MSSAQTSRFRAAAKLLPRFVAHRRRDVGEIGHALGRGDFEVIARIGHNMRGNGESYGFPEVSAIGARLETAANMRDRAAIADLAVVLEGAIANIEQSIGDAERAQSESQVRACDAATSGASAPAQPPAGEDAGAGQKRRV